MKTGILGGTFNPIHLAHLRIAEEVQQACDLDRLLFVPAAEPPHKDVAGQVSFAHRLAMVEAAIRGYSKFQASDLEIRRRGKSFSVDTLEILRKQDPHGELYFIIGLDSYRDIASWKDFTRIFSLSHLVVMTRPGVLVNDPLEPLPVAARKDFCYDEVAGTIRHKSGNNVIFLKETCLDISSTRIRSMLGSGQSVRHLVAPAVADYINEHGLYQTTIFKGSH
ncbi:MAG: nicotinate-nucleotide adenylyltransferase [Desulfuromonadales bacterium]|jgi:nicotinate-nucleotide adenylyltransferase|nr:nicotinate-nucleotide adenylyltransferase [Desulfuromonadales bacterium]